MVVVKDSDADGQEHRKRYEEIIEALLSAGYFRARISALSEFDKVVGGLCWAIVNSGVEVDVDILFTENATIGQRIALSEAIVSAMRKMKCPHSLQPHQIQGGIGGADYLAIAPVIIWLIQKFFGLREERDIQLRAFSTLQFSRDYRFPHEAKCNEVTSELAKVLLRNQATRKYRRAQNPRESETMRVHSCLLEYGELLGAANDAEGEDATAGAKGHRGSATGKGGDGSGMVAVGAGEMVSLSGMGAAIGAGSDGQPLSGFEKKLMQEALKAQKEEAIYNEMVGREQADLMGSMQSLDGQSGLVGGSLAASFLGMGGSDISQFAADYEQQVADSSAAMEKSLAGGKLGQQAAYKRQRQNLLNQQAVVEAAAAEKQTETDLVLEKLRHMEEETASAVEYNAKLTAQIEKLTLLEKGSAQQKDLSALKGLIVLNESLKGQEAAFKAGCKASMAEFNARIKALQDADKPDSEANKKLADIEDMHAKIMFKYDKLRQLLAETNLEVSANTRVIDDIPTRTELIQYERRFSELYQQVAWKLEETKKYYAMYNTLDTTLGVMQKNVKILDQIYTNFAESMQSRSGKESFLGQISTITKSVAASAKQQQDLLSSRTTAAEQLKVQYQELVDEQRAYYAAVKDFQAECDKNDWLTQKLEAAKAEQVQA